MHKRQAIRDAIKAALVGNTDCGSNVYENRSSTLLPVELPAIVIATDSETSTPRSLNGGDYNRKLNVVLATRIQVANDGSADIALDNIALQIEQAVLQSNNFGGAVYQALLTGTTVAFSADGEAYTGDLTMTYEIDYIF